MNLFNSKPSRLHAFNSASGKTKHPKLVTMDSEAGTNLIDISFLNYDWKSNIRPCQNPKYTAINGHSIQFHGVIPFVVQLGDLKTLI